MANYKNGIDTKNKLYGSAKKLFFQNGYNSTTVSNIITHASSKLGLFTYYFDSKESVASDVFSEYTDSILNALSGLKRDIYGSDDILLADMIEYRALFKCTVASPEVSLFYSELSATNAFMNTITQKRMLSVKRLAAAFVCGAGEGSAAGLSSELAVSLAAGMEVFLLRDLCIGNIRLSMNEAVDFFFRSYYRFFTADTRLIEEKLTISRELVSSLRFTVGESFRVTVV